MKYVFYFSRLFYEGEKKKRKTPLVVFPPLGAPECSGKLLEKVSTPTTPCRGRGDIPPGGFSPLGVLKRKAPLFFFKLVELPTLGVP